MHYLLDCLLLLRYGVLAVVTAVLAYDWLLASSRRGPAVSSFGDEAKGGEEFVVGMFEFIEEFDAGRIRKRTYVEDWRVLGVCSGA